MTDPREHAYRGDAVGYGYGGAGFDVVDPTVGHYGRGNGEGYHPAPGYGPSYYPEARQQHPVHHPGIPDGHYHQRHHHHHATFGQAGPAAVYDRARAQHLHPQHQLHPQQHPQHDPAAPPLPDEPPPPAPPPLPDEPPPPPPVPPSSDGDGGDGWGRGHGQQQTLAAVPQHPSLNRPMNFRDWREFQNTGESNNQKKKRWHSMPEDVRRAELVKVEAWLRERLLAEEEQRRRHQMQGQMQQQQQQHLYHQQAQQHHGQLWGQRPPLPGLNGGEHPSGSNGGWGPHADWQQQQQQQQNPLLHSSQQWPHHPQQPMDGGHRQTPPSQRPEAPSAGEAIWQQHHKDEKGKQQQKNSHQQPQKGGGSKKGAKQQEHHPQSKDDLSAKDVKKKKKKDGGGDGLLSAMSALKSLSNRWAGKDDDAAAADDAEELSDAGGIAKEQRDKEKKMSKNARKRAKRRKKAEEKKRALLEKAAEAGVIAQPSPRPPAPPQQQGQISGGAGTQSIDSAASTAPSMVTTVDLTDGVIDLTTPPPETPVSMRLVSNEPLSTASLEWQRYHQEQQPQHSQPQQQPQHSQPQQFAPQHEWQQQPPLHAHQLPRPQPSQEEMDISEDERSAAGGAGGTPRGLPNQHRHQTPPVSNFARPIPTTGYRPVSSEGGCSPWDVTGTTTGEGAGSWQSGSDRAEEDELRAILTAAASVPTAPAPSHDPLASAEAEAETEAGRGNDAGSGTSSSPAALLAPSAALVAEALAEKRERLARALKKAKLEKARAELRAAQKRKEELLKAKLRARAEAVGTSGHAAAPGEGGMPPTFGEGAGVVGISPSVTPPPLAVAVAKGRETLPDLSALQAPNLLVLNIASSGMEEQVRVFRSVAGPYKLKEEAKSQPGEVGQQEETEAAEKQPTGPEPSESAASAGLPVGSSSAEDEGAESLDPEVKKKKAEALKAKMELLKRKMKLVEQKERLKKRQRTEGEGLPLPPPVAEPAQFESTTPDGTASPVDAHEPVTSMAPRTDGVTEVPNEEVKVVEDMEIETDTSAAKEDESLMGGPTEGVSHGELATQQRPRSIEDLRRRQLELKRSIEASAASQRQIRHNLEVTNLREMVNKQRRLLSQQGTKLSESASLLKQCSEDVATEELALENSERNLEDLLRRKRILEGMVMKATRKLMKGRRRRDELLKGECEKVVLSAGTRETGGSKRGVRVQGADEANLKLNRDAGGPVGRASRKRKSCAKAADFF